MLPPLNSYHGIDFGYEGEGLPPLPPPPHTHTPAPAPVNNTRPTPDTKLYPCKKESPKQCYYYPNVWTVLFYHTVICPEMQLESSLSHEGEEPGI